MVEFLSSPYFAYETAQYGQTDHLFEALQLVLSHLVLNPVSEFAATVKPSRVNYDLSIIYLHEARLETLYKLRSSNFEVQEHQEKGGKLELNGLLHIRNFWQAHFSYNISGTYTNAPTTYSEMMRTLVHQDHAPQQWDTAVGQLSSINPNWHGHYSCTHPKTRRLPDIEEHQTCAEDWINQFGVSGVHPLKLDFASTSSLEKGWWPPIFATIPMLESTTPETGPDCGHVYIRGVAPFLSPARHPDMYPAFTGLRVRGVIHAIPDQEEIPGWRRIVMVLFKPTSRYLLAVLDENSPENDEDDPFGQITPLPALLASGGTTPQQQGQVPLLFPNLTLDQTQTQGQDQTQNQSPAAPLTPEAEEEAMREELQAREELKGPLGPACLTRDFIHKMEDKLHPPAELAWEDLNYAYAYEGVIIPGGKIMMGRYWRCGLPGQGDGFEQGDGADRGPFVFWC
jgi:hypothetical protein